MRKLIVTNIMSLDGYYEGPGKDIMALFMALPSDGSDMSFDEHNAERLRGADTLLLGRTSFDGFKSYWPSIAEDNEAPEVEREISRLDNAIEKVVVSDSLTEDQTDPWRSTTRIVKRADAHDTVADLKRGEGRDIIVFGSRTMWNDLLKRGLVDELQLFVGAVVLGGGTPIFESETPVTLDLLETKRFEDSSNVVLRYSVNQA